MATEIVATTASGKLRGTRSQGICSFKGIAYAAPTSGETRFRAPAPATPWAGVRDALQWGPRCPQERETYGDAPIFPWYAQTEGFNEDCCVLNVYTPGLDDGRRPVMVYVHGGGYVTGGGGGDVLDGSQLAAFGDVVVVTLNHRLNVFGYTNLGALDPDTFPDAANAGMLDIVAALQWIQTHIATFGGDPGRVTLFGQSGGGSKIMVLMGMPAARGLFHRAINMSGTSGTRVAPSDSTRDYVSRLLHHLGLADAGPEALRALPVDALLWARRLALQDCPEGARPVVDGRHITGSPMDPQCLANHASVPLMLGTAATEATFHFGSDDRHLALTRRQVLDRLMRQFGLDEEQAGALMMQFRRDDPARSDSDVLIALITETLYRGPMMAAADAKARAGKAPVYLYNFAWRSPVEGGRWGTPHAMDIPFAFGTIDKASAITAGAPAAASVSRTLMSAFVAFARDGKPDNPSMPAWQPYDSHARATMVIDEKCRLVEDFRRGDREAGLQVRLEPFNRSALMTYRD